MTVLKKPKKHPLKVDGMDFLRVQAVAKGELKPEWVTLDEIDAVRDLIFDQIAAQKQTHLGSLVLQ